MKLKNKGLRTGRLSRALRSPEGVLCLVLAVVVAAVTLVNPRFLTAENILSVLLSYSYTGIFALGFLFVLISGGIDISFTAIATVAQYLLALMLVSRARVPIPVVILLPILAATLLGCLNAALIHALKAPAIIITIANLNIYYGVLQFCSKGTWLYDFPSWFSAFPRTTLVSFGEAGLSVLTAIWIGLALVAAFILSFLRVGRCLYALGGNLEAATRAGLSVLRYRLFAYGFLGFCAGVGGIVHTFLTQTMAQNTLVGKEFDVVAAVVLGGASIFGGSGSVAGTVLGVALIAIVSNALTIMRVPNYWHQVFIGGILLLSIALTTLSSRLSTGKEGLHDVA